MNWEILRKYKQGTCSEEELRQLGEWLNEDPANEDFFKTFIESDEQEQEAADFYPDAREAWQKFRKTYGIPASPETAAPHTKKLDGNIYMAKRRDRRYWYSVAVAAVILFVALVYAVPQWKAMDESASKEKIAAQEITTAKGQRTHLRLSDGTQVVLNAESRLRIPESYGQGSRTLYLEGEAFFDVRHDEEQPFVVISPQGYVKDLGTQFNVMTYDSTQYEVAVKEGLVAMGTVKAGTPQKKLVELTPNKLGILKTVGGLTVSDIENISLFTGWANGRLIFKQTPFSEVARRLERWFGITCTIKNPELYQRTLTATYDQMPLNEVLQVLSASLRLSYERTGKEVIFRAKNR